MIKSKYLTTSLSEHGREERVDLCWHVASCYTTLYKFSNIFRFEIFSNYLFLGGYIFCILLYVWQMSMCDRKCLMDKLHFSMKY